MDAPQDLSALRKRGCLGTNSIRVVIRQSLAEPYDASSCPSAHGNPIETTAPDSGS